MSIAIRKNSKNNPLIFHRRYLFVNDDYTGFNVSADRKRAERWEKFPHDTNKIGRLSYWTDFLKKHGIRR